MFIAFKTFGFVIKRNCFHLYLCRNNVLHYAGGLDPEHVCPVDYRTELREAKARVDLPAYRAILDELGYSPELVLHAIESQMKETGAQFGLRSLYTSEHYYRN